MNMELHIHGYGCYEYQALTWAQYLYKVLYKNTMSIQCLYNVLYSWIWSAIFMDMDVMNIKLCPEYNVYTMSMPCLVQEYNVYTMSCIHEYGAPYSKNEIFEFWALTWIQYNVCAMSCTRRQCLYNVLYSWIWSAIFMDWFYEYQALTWIQYNVYTMSCTRIQCLYNVLYSWIWSAIFMDIDSMTRTIRGGEIGKCNRGWCITLSGSLSVPLSGSSSVRYSLIQGGEDS